ncbi:DNA topoisomerase IV, A subunit [Candidatus Endolissoclinum faulkneri L2]|uniref:DNA topoisomerase 4 subunit A n=1 Tax=Candidatus Endolissoclinum faulkneri L2 TaxID=1193729 RepID=K7ZDK9_9PROT|nr:DNA topoisomerase IV subunit A [Candidatus Endolissoclinum faulkneri]AFX99616.1 DNA topoisomerase IV, A subunit [Candidatus Endolissoclinum faulkneri L2]
MSMKFSLLSKPPQELSQAEAISDAWLADALSERYLAYALSTIMGRSLPDVRDGLKPVHRRLLFAMRQLKLSPDRAFKKSARVVGDVMGKFHPHGDAAIYDAMVRLARDFTVRYPLVEGHGNFGNVDGDNAAAMRYTEARLTEVAQLLMEEIDDDTIDFRTTYDGEGEEPVVFPAAFPNLLANGSQGIAVGMATSIPPHNVDELCEALQYLIKNREARIENLLDKIAGPDFPTGGILVESPETLKDAYRSGKGSFRVRARWNVERLKNGTWQVAITEIPYQVQKSRLIERIAELLHARKLAFLGDIRDESANDVRVVLEPKSRNVDPDVLMESLFKQTELQVRVLLNLNVLDKDNVPRVMGMPEALKAFLHHRHEVLIRKTKHRLNNIAHRLEILLGYQIAFLNIDQMILLIQEENEPKAELIRTFQLTEGQSEAIMNMRLRSLQKLEEIKLKKEHEQLSAERDNLIDLLSNEKRRWQIIGEQLSQIRRKFGKSTEIGRRRTDIISSPNILAIPSEAMVEREPITVICSEKFWIRALRGYIDLDQEIKYKEGDGERFRFHAETTDKILLFATDGRFYTICGDKLPSGRGHGEPIRLIIDLANDDDIVAIFPHRSGEKLLVASNDGRGFIVSSNEVLAQTRAGKQVLGIDEDSKALACIPVTGDTVAVIGTNRKMLIFDVNDLPEMSRGKGVILQNYKSGDSMADLMVFKSQEGLSWLITSGCLHHEDNLATWRGKRAAAGKLLPSGLPLPIRSSCLD